MQVYNLIYSRPCTTWLSHSSLILSRGQGHSEELKREPAQERRKERTRSLRVEPTESRTIQLVQIQSEPNSCPTLQRPLSTEQLHSRIENERANSFLDNAILS